MKMVAFVKRNILLLAIAAGGISLSIAVPLQADDDLPCPLPETAAGDTSGASMTSGLKSDDDDVMSPEKKKKKHKMKHNRKDVCMDADTAAAHASHGDVDQGDCE